MTHCLTEEWIEQIAIDHLHDPGAALPDHLMTCEFCQSTFQSMVDLHRDVIVGLKDIDVSSRIENIDLRINIKNPHLFLLHPIDRYISVVQQSDYRNTLVADSSISSSQSSRVENLGVFASSDGRLMVRIIRGVGGGITIFLLSDKEELYKHVLVRIIGLDQEYVTDSNGSVDLGEIDLPDILELGVEVRTASDKYDLKSLVGNAETLIGEGEIVLASESSKQIKMEIIPVGGLYSLKVTLAEHVEGNSEKRIKVMVVRNDQPPLVESSVHGVALFQEINDPYAIQVNIFE